MLFPSPIVPHPPQLWSVNLYPKRIIVEPANNAPLSTPLESVNSSPTILSLNSTPTSSSHQQCSTSTDTPQVLTSHQLKPYSPFEDPIQNSPNIMLHSTPLSIPHQTPVSLTMQHIETHTAAAQTKSSQTLTIAIPSNAPLYPA
jgi:hypothetical protein